MKIIQLKAENIKKLVAVEITPDGNLVQITGKNGNGKTSVLDSIWWALEGTDAIQGEPIRKGADKALIRLDLGELVVTRKFSRKDEGGYTTAITVENAEGVRLSSPQTVVDALLGALSFDPLEFSRLKPAEQLTTLRGLVKGVDFAAVDKANKDDFQKRQDINRRVKELRAQSEGITVPDDLPAEPIDEAKIREILSKAGAHNEQIAVRKQRRADVARNAVQLREQGNEMAEKASDNRARAAQLILEAEELEAKSQDLLAQSTAENQRLADAPPLAELIDTAAVTQQLAEAQATNAQIALAGQKAGLAAQADQLQAQADALTEAMEARTKATEEAVKAAKLPIEGIGFGEDCVTLRGVPFEQGSDAERLRASVAIAMALNPKLRVIRIRDGSLLDEDGLKLVAEAADAADMQVWIERVESSGKVGFTLVDGMVVAHDGEPVAAPAPATTKPAKASTKPAAAAKPAAPAPAPTPPPEPQTGNLLGDDDL